MAIFALFRLGETGKAPVVQDQQLDARGLQGELWFRPRNPSARRLQLCQEI